MDELVCDQHLFPVGFSCRFRFVDRLAVLSLNSDIVHLDELVDLLALLGQLLGAARNHALQLVLVLGQFGQHIFNCASAQHSAHQSVTFAVLVDCGQRFDDGSVGEASGRNENGTVVNMNSKPD